MLLYLKKGINFKPLNRSPQQPSWISSNFFFFYINVSIHIPCAVHITVHIHFIVLKALKSKRE